MTIQIFTKASCSSSRSAKKWLNEKGLEFEEKNIAKTVLNYEDFKYILSLTEDGTDEILAVNSKAYKTLNVDVDNLSMVELYHLILEHPRLLRTPIIIDKFQLQVGYSEHEMCRFLPRKMRAMNLSQLIKRQENSMVDSFDDTKELVEVS